MVKLLDTRAAAAYLGTTERHVRRLVAERGLPVVMLGGKRRFSVNEIDAWIERNSRVIGKTA